MCERFETLGTHNPYPIPKDATDDTIVKALCCGHEERFGDIKTS